MGLLLCAIWLYYLGGYHGLFHDGRLYALLALNHLQPGFFGRDLFVAPGSQGGFTIFPAVQAFFIGAFGLETSTFILTAAGLCAWFAALITLTRRLMPGWSWALAVLGIVTAARYYDAYKVFVYSESFVSPRLYAEAFSLFGAAKMLRGQPLRSLPWLIGAALCHPLMAAYPLLLAFLLFLGDASRDRRLRIALGCASLLALTALYLTHYSVFAGLFVPYDAHWLDLSLLRAPFLVPANWDSDMAAHILYLAGILLIGWRSGRSPISRHAPTILGAATLLLAAWGIGTTFWHDRLLIQLQPWRCIWLLQILALTELAGLLWQLWQGNAANRWMAAMLTASWLQAGGLTGGSFCNNWLALACVLGGIVLAALVGRLPPQVSQRPLIGILPFLAPLPNLLSNLTQARALSFFAVTSPDALSWRAMALAALGGASAAGLCWCLGRRGNRATPLAWLITLLGSAACLASLANWSEPFWRQFSRTPDARPSTTMATLQARIPANALVVSDKGVEWIWFKLHRASYVSNTQLASVALSRDIAMLGERRMQHLCASGFTNCSLSYTAADAPSMDGRHLDSANLRTLCTDPDLDYAILEGRHGDAELLRDNSGTELSLVDCARLRGTSGKNT